MKLRVFVKWLISRFILIDSYCKDCGIDINDFVASDSLWKEVMGDSQKTVCYNCFCKRSGHIYKIEKHL
jgi:hypothetical protein